MKKILLVDDDQIVARLYQFAFQKSSFETVMAADGESALKTLETLTPDLMVLDLMLPKIHGIEVIKKVRANARTATLPILVLSNAYLSTMVKAAWQAGANQCLTKAECTPDKLVEVVRGMLGLPAPSPSPGPVPIAPPASLAASAQTSSAAPAVTAPASPGVKLTLPATAMDPRTRFLAEVPLVNSALKITTSSLEKNQIDNLIRPKLPDLAKLIQDLLSPAEPVPGPVTRMAQGLTRLVNELIEEPEIINFSTVKTLAHGVEFLEQLLSAPPTAATERTQTPLVLVVDDEVISRRMVMSSIKVAGLRPLSVEDPTVALKLLGDNNFDLIILDVDMPGMSGYDLCTHLRALPNHKTTPVVFVTGMTAQESRARSILSGANDLVGKPLVLAELSVKALTLILKSAVKPAK